MSRADHSFFIKTKMSFICTEKSPYALQNQQDAVKRVCTISQQTPAHKIQGLISNRSWVSFLNRLNILSHSDQIRNCSLHGCRYVHPELRSLTVNRIYFYESSMFLDYFLDLGEPYPVTAHALIRE